MDYSLEEKQYSPVGQKLTGAQILVESLKRENVEVLFGYPGGAVLPIYDKLYQSGVFHVLTRHEQGGIHAAEGYARVAGKPGVVIATSGPGATNLVTGLTDAMIDSIPLVVFTGQVASSVIGTDAFQEADVIGITMPITKHNYQVRKISDIPKIIREAFFIASTGRPGPVLIDIPKDVAAELAEYQPCDTVHLPGYKVPLQPDHVAIRSLVEAIGQSKRPAILAGAGVLFANASEELYNFATQYNIPVIHTLLGLGGFPADHSLFLGMAGMHGTYTANMAITEADLLISIGARFDDRVTGNLKRFAQKAKIAHIDIDEAEIGKNVPTAIPVVGDAKYALQALIDENGSVSENDDWITQLNAWKERYPLGYHDSTDELKPQKLIELIYEATNGEAIVTTDVGQHQMWSAQYYKFKHPNRWVTSGGLGTMGFGLPSSIGAQLADRSKTVVAILGDGGFQMTLQELSVIQELNLPIKIVLVNNQTLGMVRQWQELFYEERYSYSLIPNQPDFLKLADAYGILGLQASNTDEARAILKRAMETNGPVLLDFRVTQKENVYPMVAPGKGLDEMEGYEL
ncbi:MAG: acetolactate synthase large subunit [Bacilli bacterium]